MADQQTAGDAGNNKYDGINFMTPFIVQDVNHIGGNDLSLSLRLQGGLDANQVMNYLRQGSPILFCPPDAAQYLAGKQTGGDYKVDFNQPFMVNEVSHTGDRITLRVTIPQAVDWDEWRTYLKDGSQILAVPPDAVHLLTQGRTASAGAGGGQ